MDYLRQLQADDDVRAETMRAAGGVLLGLAALAIALRKSGAAGGEAWSDLAILFVVGIPALILFGGGVAAASRADMPRPWHAAWVVFGIVLLYLTTQQMIEVVEGDAGAPLNVAWTFAVVAVASLIAARETFARFGWLAAGIAAAISFLAVCDELSTDGIFADLDTIRILCMVIFVALLAAAFFAQRSGLADEDEGSELITAAGIFFVLGAGIASIAVLSVGAALSTAPGAVPPVDRSAVPEPSLFWDVVLGLGSLLLVAAGNLLDKRGPVYVGTIGLIVFVAATGTDLDNPERDGSLVGWPLVLTVAAIAAIAASLLISTRKQTPRTETQPDPGGTPWSP